MIDYKHSATVLVHTDPVNAVISPENDRPASLVPDLIDYNMPLTTTYLKQMKLQRINNKEQVHLILGSLFLTDNTFALWSLSLTDTISVLCCGCSWEVQVFLVLLNEPVCDWTFYIVGYFFYIKCFKKKLILERNPCARLPCYTESLLKPSQTADIGLFLDFILWIYLGYFWSRLHW